MRSPGFCICASVAFRRQALGAAICPYGCSVAALSGLKGDTSAQPHCVQVRRSDVKSAWSGIRPLASDPNASDTASASRDHVVTMDEDGMITVTGTRL